MRPDRSIILHVGAPKCGSSALQAALSAAQRLTSDRGETLVYTGLRAKGDGWTPVSGRLLRLAASRAVHGYVSWPNPNGDDPKPLFAALDKVRAGGGRSLPVVSNEGWIGQAETFATALPHWFREGDGGRIEICAFARPPLDWLNAAYWQWGVWSGLEFGAWLDKMGMPYAIGAALTRWAALPNTVVRVNLGQDVLAGFEADHGVTLPRPSQRNAALPAALIGFLMRNRRYRRGAHDSATDFIFQRWCKVEGAARPWAILPRHLRLLRASVRADLDLLFGLLPEQQAGALRENDPRWSSEDPYRARLLRGRSSLDDPEELAELYQALVRGVAAACEAAGQAVPQLPPVLSTQASIHSWDVAVAQALEHLIALDEEMRRKRWLFGV
ncbi:hypothetical protein [Mameliella sediminis]|uniref:hypothetical protein n=1 Tax=Mameliella sediminis TaxID=2836866 RepID=UPI001C43D4B8|nr:hypothetical protein [Mameliella sediminis]MBV7397344.1 hypothetical protein [Mameliella sediminis]